MHRPDGLDAAIEEARTHDPRVVVEAMLEGREIECGVLEGFDGGPPEASVPGEVVVGGDHEFYDFAAKYLPDEGTSLVVPAELPERVTDEVRDLACRAFEALGCEGLDDCFNPTFIALPGPEIDVRESRTAAFRRERELWQTVTFALVEPFPPPTPAAGGRWRLRPVIRQSGLRHGSIEPAAAVQFSMEFDLAFVGDGWRVVGF